MKYTTENFIKELIKFKSDPLIVIGIGELMGIKMPDKNEEIGDSFAENFLIEVIEKFEGLSSTKKKRIMKIMKGTYRK